MRMEAQVVSSEFVILKDTVWKLSSRVMLLEGFIKKQFGNVFWKFCESQVDSLNNIESLDTIPTVKPPPPPPKSKSPPQEKLNMPPMIRIFNNTSNSNNQHSSTASSSSHSSNNGAATITPKNNKPIPPPPPLSCIKNNQTNVKSEPSTYQHKPRNFLPKSLAKPKLSVNSSNNAIISNSGGGGGSGSILKPVQEPSSVEDVGPSNNSSDSSDSFRYIKTEPNVNQQFLKKSSGSPAVISLPLKQNRLSSLIQPMTAKLSSAAIPTRTPFMGGNVNYADLEYYKGEGDSESSDDLDYGADGYLAAELVAATLAGGADAELSISSSSSKKMRFNSSFGTPANPANSALNMNGSCSSTPRQMRPNPCHTRCQNRCHDIWTDGDRMGVFETYWSIPAEEERREFVAQRIERVDMATKRTEFSNFRTCTFKYYLPHPDNPWVQVCKNFFLATIDEKRSYIEKIAQSVKGETEKISAKDIPFRRRNQMRSVGAGGSVDYVGWMTGMGLGVDGVDGVDEGMIGEDQELGELEGDGIHIDQEDQEDGDQDIHDPDGDDQEHDGDGDGLEMMEEATD